MTDTRAEHGGYAFSVAEHSVDYDDPHANHAADGVVAELRELQRIASIYYGETSGLDRKRLSTMDLENPATARLIGRLPTVAHWLSQIPTAAALHPLYEPDTETYLTGVALDDEIRDWFRNIADAHGIRSRAHVMRQILEEEAAASTSSQQWLSLACGAAQPVFAAVESLRTAEVLLPHVTLADLDRSALEHATTYAHDRGLRRQVTVRRTNVLARRLHRTRRRWDSTFDIVDAVGILEYLKPQDWTYSYSGIITTRRKLAGAVTFLRNAFACVRPGGLLVVGNMLDTHPQLEFTLNVVQWPHIQPRSVSAMLDIFDAAGLGGHVDVYLPTDGVYAIYAIRKPG